MMSDRYTRRDAERAFERLCETMGREIGPKWSRVNGKNVAKVGTWHLDYNAVYGGCKVAEIANVAGGESEPFGSLRQSPRDFVHSVNMAIRAVEMDRRQTR